MSTTLLERVADGDMGAVQACIDEYAGLVWSLARRGCNSPEEAEDAVQEAYIAIWENASRFDPQRGSEATFIAMITRRRLIDRGRKRQRYDRVVERARDLVERSRVDVTPSGPIADDVQRAESAMDELSDPQRRVLTLAIHRGLTHEQIARVLDMPLGTVKTHARRGLKKVRDFIARNDEEGETS